MSHELTVREREITDTAMEWRNEARNVSITDEHTYQVAAGHLRGVKALLKEADSVFDEPIKKAHAAHKAMLAAKKEVTAPLKEAEGLLKRGLADYTTQQEQKRLEEFRRQEAIDEAVAKMEREAAAADLEWEGDDQGASEVRSARLSMPPVNIPDAVPKVAGISTRTLWKARVHSMVALVEFVHNYPGHIHLLEANVKALHEMARHTKGPSHIPGVEFYSEKSVAAG